MGRFERLVEIMDRLRGEDGCPWDREQTRETLKTYLIEEAYELLEALDADDPGLIREELGDLLFQLIFHARIASEKGEFDIWDVIDGITEKMVARHPHVFGDTEVQDSREVIQRWEELKKKEGKMKDSLLEGIPEALPSLLRAHRVQERVSRVGFDWEDIEGALEKVEEEFEEFRDALRKSERQQIEEELGDLFFSLVNLSRFVGINPEEALRKTVTKFARRFRYIEKKAEESSRSLSEMSLEEMEKIWQEAKGREGG
jgi:tetrapyrrole methylase family protein/MazG family protein